MVRPKKSFGQNFLVNPNACRQIVASLDLNGQDPVLEIGPGKGALTEHLLAAAGHVLAVEADRDCVAYLKDRFSGFPNLEVIQADFLKQDLSRCLGEKKWKAVGNLPYNAAAPILFRMFDGIGSFERMVFMFQREVARRITARAGQSSAGFLSVACQFYTEPAAVLELKPGSFRPVPRVHSSVVRFIPRADVPFGDPAGRKQFLSWVDGLFRQRRKMVFPRLAETSDPGALAANFSRLTIERNARPQDLTVEQWAKLYSLLQGL